MSVPILMLSVAAGYLLGALPIADQLSRRHGVDIFSTGTGLAGAANVLRSVGKWPALLVLCGDMAKGVLTILIADFLGVSGLWILLPAAGAVVGHWNSVFSGFRGGDGLATLGGITVALFGVYGLIGVAISMLVSLGGQRMPYTSLLNIVFGYGTLSALNLANNGDVYLTLGIGGLAAIVLSHAAVGHVRRRRANAWMELEDAGGATGATGTRPSQ
jgi:glycerol-3-phosphate acyltransferase PlsY